MSMHRVAVFVSQPAAARAAKNTWGRQVVEVDVTKLTDEERDELARLQWEPGRDGVLQLTTQANYERSDLPEIAEATLDAVRVLLAARRPDRIEHEIAAKAAAVVAAAEEAQKQEARVQELLADEPGWLTVDSNPHARRSVLGMTRVVNRARSDGDAIRHDPRIVAKLEAVQAEADRRNATLIAEYLTRPIDQSLKHGDSYWNIADDAWTWQNAPELQARYTEVCAEQERRNAPIRATEEQREREKAEYIPRWVAEHGTANQQARQAAGVLPLGEVTDAIEASLFAVLDDEPRYDKLQSADAEHTDECDQHDCGLHYSVDPAATMPAAVWDRLQELKAKLGRDDATFTVRIHQAETDCEMITERYGIRIQIDEGGYEFARQYACPENTNA